MDDWEWCGTGASKFEILPNDSASFEVWFRDEERRERVLGGFTEKGTNRKWTYNSCYGTERIKKRCHRTKRCTCVLEMV